MVFFSDEGMTRKPVEAATPVEVVKKDNTLNGSRFLGMSTHFSGHFCETPYIIIYHDFRNCLS